MRQFCQGGGSKKQMCDAFLDLSFSAALYALVPSLTQDLFAFFFPQQCLFLHDIILLQKHH